MIIQAVLNVAYRFLSNLVQGKNHKLNICEIEQFVFYHEIVPGSVTSSKNIVSFLQCIFRFCFFYQLSPTMKTLNVIFLSAVIALLFSACKKEKSCPGFDDADMIEFSYQKLDTLMFESESDERFQVYIEQISRSEPYEYECRDLYGICPCINYVEAIATDSRTATPYVFLRMEQSDVSDMQYFKYNVWGFEFEFDFVNELPFIDDMDMFSHYGSFLMDGKVYYDVVVVNSQDDEAAAVSQVFFTKREGVIRFVEKASGIAWNLRE